MEQSQAQVVFVDIFPSQDNLTTHTLWLFNTTNNPTVSLIVNGYIRRSGNNYNTRDTFKTTGGNLYAQNLPTNATFTLSALTPSSLTSTNRDYDSLAGLVNTVLPSGVIIPGNATNTPTISFGVGSSATISTVYMHHYNGGDNHDLGIRVSGGTDLVYNTGSSMRWFGAGTINKPITDFQAGSYRSQANSFGSFFPDQGALVRVHSNVIPEPEEYTLVFGLFALSFVLLRRRMQQKRQQTTATS